MVKFLAIFFFSWISSIFVGVFQMFSFFLCHSVQELMTRRLGDVTSSNLTTFLGCFVLPTLH